MTEPSPPAAAEPPGKSEGIAETIESSVEAILIVIGKFLRTYWRVLTRPHRPEWLLAEKDARKKPGVGSLAFLAVGCFLLALTQQADRENDWIWTWADRFVEVARKNLDPEVSLVRVVLSALPLIAGALVGADLVSRLAPAPERRRVGLLVRYALAFSYLTSFIAMGTLAIVVFGGDRLVPGGFATHWPTLAAVLDHGLLYFFYALYACAFIQPALLVASGLGSLRPTRAKWRAWVRGIVAGLCCVGLALANAKATTWLHATERALFTPRTPVKLPSALPQVMLTDSRGATQLTFSVVVQNDGPANLLIPPTRLYVGVQLPDGGNPKVTGLVVSEPGGAPTVAVVQPGEARPLSVQIAANDVSFDPDAGTNLLFRVGLQTGELFSEGWHAESEELSATVIPFP